MLEDKFTSNIVVCILAENPAAQSATMQLTVNLRDVNDNRPVFDQSLYSVVLNENVAGDTIVSTVQATDIDSGVNMMIQYFLDGGDGATAFVVDATTGQIRTAVRVQPI